MIWSIYIVEVAQNTDIIRYAVVVIDSPDFRIVLVQDFKVITVDQVGAFGRDEDFPALSVCDFQRRIIKQLLLPFVSGNI